LITNNDCWNDQEKQVIEGVDAVLSGSKLDAVICVAGGWAGGNAASDGITLLLHSVFILNFI
jgi:hypothetical protein